MIYKTLVSIPFLISTMVMPAYAAEPDYCHTVEGIEYCGYAGSQSDRLTMRGHAVLVDMNIRCTIPNDTEYAWEWELNQDTLGGFTDDELDEFAQGYCEGRLGLDGEDLEEETAVQPTAV